MNWNSIKFFLAIVEFGTLSAAARALGVNHSTIFRRLNAFEKEIEGRLFERFNHGYELTPMGEELLPVAKNIASSFDNLERHIVGKHIQPKGTVKITVPNNLAYRYLPTYLKQLNLIYPDIRIELLISNLEFNMTNRQADIAIRATGSPPEHLVGRKVRTINWSVYGSSNYEKEFGLPRNLEELKNHLLIGATGGMRSLPAFIWLENTFPQQIRVRCDDLVAMSYMVESGQGLAFLPDDQQRPELKRLFTFIPGESSDLWLLTHPDLRNVERIKLTMQHLATAFEEENVL